MIKVMTRCNENTMTEQELKQVLDNKLFNKLKKYIDLGKEIIIYVGENIEDLENKLEQLKSIKQCEFFAEMQGCFIYV